MLGSEKLLKPEYQDPLEKTLNDVVGVYIQLLLNVQNRLIYLIHQEGMTLSFSQALNTIVCYNLAQEGSQQLFVYCFKKVARASNELQMNDIDLFLNYFPHEHIYKDHFKNDKVLCQLSYELYPKISEKIEQFLDTVENQLFLTLFQGVIMYFNSVKGKRLIQYEVINKFLNQFFTRLSNKHQNQQKISITQYQTQIIPFIQIYSKLFLDSSSNIKQKRQKMFDNSKICELLWNQCFYPKLKSQANIHQIAGIAWLLVTLQNNIPVIMFEELKNKIESQLRSYQKHGYFNNVPDYYQQNLQETIHSLKVIKFIVTQVSQTNQHKHIISLIDRVDEDVKAKHGGYFERKKWFYF